MKSYQAKKTPPDTNVVLFGYTQTSASDQKIALNEKASNKKQINFCAKMLVEISPTISFFCALESLQLCCNELKAIPPELCSLINLKSLFLSRNKIFYLPDAIGNLINLAELNISQNKLEVLPRNIIKLTKLKTLSFEDNKISQLPQELGYLPELSTLDASRNELQYIPIEINRLKNLKKLRLDGNPLLTEDLFIADVYYCPSLKDLAGMSFFKDPLSKLRKISELSTYQSFSMLTVAYLGDVAECSSCHGPILKGYIRRIRFVAKCGINIPCVYRLCANHWNDEISRIKHMFEENLKVISVLELLKK